MGLSGADLRLNITHGLVLRCWGVDDVRFHLCAIAEHPKVQSALSCTAYTLSQFLKHSQAVSDLKIK